MPLGRESRQSRNSGNVVQRHSMPASMAAGGMSSARWRLRTTRCLFSSAHGARGKPQLPITTEVMPCQQDEVPSGSQKICASMWVWPSIKPGVTTWPSASITSRARSRMRPIVTMRPWRTPTSARYRGRPDPSTTVPFLIARSYDILNSPRDRAGSATYSDFELKGSPRRRHLLSAHYRLKGLASSEAPPQRALPLPLGAVGDLHRLLLEVEAQCLLRLDVTAGDPNEERVVAVLDRVDVADRDHGGVTGLVQEVALELELGVAGLAPVVEAAPAGHARRILVVPVDHPARTVVVGDRLAALFASVDQHVHVGLGIVADGRALAIRHRIAEMLLQELRIAQELLEVIADLGEPRWDALRLDRGASVGKELVQRVRGVGGHGELLSSWMIAGRGRAEGPGL